MDPFSAVSAANEGLSILIKAIKIIKTVVEKIKNVTKNLDLLVRSLERVRNSLIIIKGISRALQKVPRYAHELIITLDKERLESVFRDVSSFAVDLERIHDKNKWLAGLSTLRPGKDVAAMTKTLEELEQEQVHSLTLITTLSSVESWVGLQELPQRLKTLNLHSTRDHAWSAPDPDATKAASLPLLQPPPSSDSAPSAMRMWLGNTLVETAPSMAYLNAWNTLANASWGFDFPLIQKLLREGPGLDEQWVNLYRPKTRQEISTQSRWTVLHQAVYNGASLEAVQWLVQAGAFRTLRTQHARRFSNRDITALELAIELGSEYLFDILAPVMRHQLPVQLQAQLQDRLHTLIQCQLGSLVDELHLWLPEIEPLMELGDEALHFPIRGHHNADASYVFRLDGRSILVRAINIVEPHSGHVFRVEASRVSKLETAILIQG